jgi:hypothetical protein
MNGCFNHQRQLSNFDRCCHCWSKSHRYNVENIDDDNTCSKDGCLGKNTILHQMNTKQWLHSPHYWVGWVSSFLFWFIFYHMCTNHHYTPLAVFFSPFNVCFSLLTTCVHNLVACTSHNDSSTSYYTWLRFLIFSTHHN